MNYCTRADVERIFGAENVAKWADLNSQNDQTEITDRIEHAIAVATADVDSRLLCSIYRVPLASSIDGVPLLIREVTASLAGVYLFENRGVSETAIHQPFPNVEPVPIHPYSFKRVWAYQVLDDLRTGKRRLKEIV